jgi:hypothetical protein
MVFKKLGHTKYSSEELNWIFLSEIWEKMFWNLFLTNLGTYIRLHRREFFCEHAKSLPEKSIYWIGPKGWVSLLAQFWAIS